ncbi:MAG: hypothetical protein A3H91_11420 [Gammaproteobacteria bacterium RIFCSPLOWO2_02_FULL_61_13]|nr:MAG: hypothetical protein A3H91_11420 [Gammaproteobacteria bacterium RIFCSPLOWO2_02_FULL_61_13]
MGRMRFQDQVVLVTGGNSGIGLASAMAFANEGARVVITGRNAETLSASAERIGQGAMAIQSDSSDLDAMDKLMLEIRQAHGRIDVLFANAGIGEFAPVEAVSEGFWNRIIGTNLKGPYFTVQKALPMMQKGGSIVLNASVAHAMGIPNASVYSASKAAIRSLARSLAAELVGRGIRVNSISPGAIETPILGRSGLNEEQQSAVRKSFTDNVPMQRFGTADEAANAVLFLASDEASYITGIDMLVDGGWVSC